MAENYTNNVNVTNVAVEEIRREILGSRFKPGDRLKQEELAQLCGSSRTPVRDALRELEKEGLVTLGKGRSARIPDLDFKDFCDIYKIRTVIEELAARLAVARADDHCLLILKECISDMKRASTANDMEAWLISDKEFHLSYYKTCDNQHLLDLVTRYWNSTCHFRKEYYALPEQIKKSEEIHDNLFQAMVDRDEDLAATLTRSHFKESIKIILQSHIRC